MNVKFELDSNGRGVRVTIGKQVFHAVVSGLAPSSLTIYGDDAIAVKPQASNLVRIQYDRREQ